MAERTVVHIGLPKTGTTYLQTMMWRNRPLLRAQGFLYPGRDRMEHFHAARAVARFPGDLTRSQEILGRIVEEVRAWPGTALVSHEFLSAATAAEAGEFLEALGPTDLRVVVTARDYLRQFPAVWQEALKMGNAATLGDFMDTALAPGAREAIRRDLENDVAQDEVSTRPWGWPTQDLTAVLQRWTRATGIERVRLVTVPQADAPRELLWERWRAVAGLDDAGFDLAAARPNESLGAAQAALLVRVVEVLTEGLAGASVRHRWVRQYLGHEVLVPQGGERIGLAERHAKQLRDLSESTVADLRQAGYEVIGDLGELLPAERDARTRNPDEVPEAEILDAGARAIEQMVRDVRELTYRARDAEASIAPVAEVAKHRIRDAARRVRERFGRR